MLCYSAYGEPNDANSSQGDPNKKSKESEVKNDKPNPLTKKGTTPDTNNLVPFIGDETPLSLIEAYPERYVEESFYLIGAIKTTDIYFSKYYGAEKTHVAFDFQEIRPNKTSTGKFINLYLKKHLSQSLVETIVKTIQSGYSWKVVRVEVSILSRRFEPGSVMTAELLNWQTLTDDRYHWSEWQIISEPPSSKTIESDKIIYQGIERNEKWFNSMYNRFGNKIIYVNGEYRFVNEQIVRPRILDSNAVNLQVGAIVQFRNPCKVKSLLGTGDVIASTNLSTDSLVHLQGIDNAKEGIFIPRGFKFIYIGQFNSDNRIIPDFRLLKSLNKEEFYKALKSDIDLPKGDSAN